MELGTLQAQADAALAVEETHEAATPAVRFAFENYDILTEMPCDLLGPVEEGAEELNQETHVRGTRIVVPSALRTLTERVYAYKDSDGVLMAGRTQVSRRLRAPLRAKANSRLSSR